MGRVLATDYSVWIVQMTYFLDEDNMQPLLFDANGTQLPSVTLSASSVDVDSDIDGLSVTAAQFGEWSNVFRTAVDDELPWIQVRLLHWNVNVNVERPCNAFTRVFCDIHFVTYKH